MLKFKFFVSSIIKNPFFTGSLVMIVGSNTINALSYLFHLITGRLLGPISYGELASLVSLAGLLGVIPGSLNLVVIKYISVAKNDEERNILLSWFQRKAFQLAIITFAIIILASPVITSFMHISKFAYVITIAVTTLFSLPALFNRSLLQGLLKFKEMVITTLIEFIIKLIGAVLFIYLGYRVGGVMIALVLSSSIGYYLTVLYLKPLVNRGVYMSFNIKSMVFYAIPVGIQSLAMTSLYSSDLVLVKHFFTSHQAGIYASMSTLGKIIFFGTSPIGAVMFPLISHKQSKGGQYNKLVIYSFLATLILSICVLVVYWLFPAFSISLLYGQSYLEGSNLLIWFGIFITFFTLSSLLISFHLSLGRTKVVILPLVAAITQVLAIWFYHEDLFTVIIISILVTALLLGSLLIYSSYEKGAPRY